MISLIQREAVAVQALILAAVNLLLVFGIVHWTPDQLAAVNAILVGALGGIVRALVTPVAPPPPLRSSSPPTGGGPTIP